MNAIEFQDTASRYFCLVLIATVALWAGPWPSHAQECVPAGDYWSAVTDAKSNTLSTITQVKVVTEEEVALVDAAVTNAEKTIKQDIVPCNIEQEAYAIAVIDYLTALGFVHSCDPLYYGAIDIEDVNLWLACIAPYNAVLLEAYFRMGATGSALISNNLPPDPSYVPPAGWGTDPSGNPLPDADPTPREILEFHQEVINSLVLGRNIRQMVGPAAGEIVVEGQFTKTGLKEASVSVVREFVKGQSKKFFEILKAQAVINISGQVVPFVFSAQPGGAAALRGAPAVPPVSPVHQPSLILEITTTHYPEDGSQPQSITTPVAIPLSGL